MERRRSGGRAHHLSDQRRLTEDDTGCWNPLQRSLIIDSEIVTIGFDQVQCTDRASLPPTYQRALGRPRLVRLLLHGHLIPGLTPGPMIQTSQTAIARASRMALSVAEARSVSEV